MTRPSNPKRRGTFGLTFWVLGVAAAALSLTSLVQDWSDIGLDGLAERVVAYYREVTQVAKQLLFDWWTTRLWSGFELPQWGIDLLCVWLLTGFGVLRGVLMFDAAQREPSFRVGPEGRPDPVAGWTAVAIVLFAPLAYLLFSAAAVVALRAIWKERNKVIQPGVARHRLQDVIALLGGMYAPLLAAALFFLWNAVQI